MGALEKIKSVLAPNVQNTFKRFSVPILCSVILYCLVFTDLEGAVRGLLPLSLVCGYFCFGIARLYAEANLWPSYKEGLLGIILTIFITLLTFIAFANSGIIFFPIGLVLLGLMTAPFIFRKSDDFSFWLYNRMLCHGVGIGILAGLLLAGGLTIAFLSINWLFGKFIPAEISGYLWTFAAVIYSPFIALSLVPQKFDVPEEDCPNSEGVTFALNWIMAPLAVLYFAIFYAYGAKVLIIGEMPKGMVAWMVLGFGILGIFIYLTAAPLREKSRALVKFLYKRFFLLLLPPAGFLAAAVYLRIDQYGLTEARYMLVLITLWFLYLAVQFTWKPQTPIKRILTSLLVLILISSFGPWGAAKTSETAQVMRLEKALERSGMLLEGRAVPAKGAVSKADSEIIASSIDYLSIRKRGVWAQRLIPALGQKSDRNAQAILAGLKIEHTLPIKNSYRTGRFNPPKDEGFKNIHFQTRVKRSINVDGYDMIYPDFSLNLSANTTSASAALNQDLQNRGEESETIVLENNKLYYRSPLQPDVEIPLAEILPQIRDTRPADHAQPLVVWAEGNGKKYKLILENITLRDYGNGARRIQHVRGHILVDFPD